MSQSFLPCVFGVLHLICSCVLCPRLYPQLTGVPSPNSGDYARIVLTVEQLGQLSTLPEQQHRHIDIDENTEDVAQSCYKGIAHHGWVQSKSLED